MHSPKFVVVSGIFMCQIPGYTENRHVFAKDKNRHNQVLKYALKYIKEIMIEKSKSAYFCGRSLSVEILFAEKYDVLEKLEIFF